MRKELVILSLIVLFLITGCTTILGGSTSSGADTQLSDSSIDDVFNDLSGELIDESNDIELGSMI